MELMDRINASFDDMCACRRDLHRHPEQGFLEFRTASIVAERLTQLGYEVVTGADAMDDKARMGMPEADTIAAAFQRAKAQGADEKWLSQMEGGLTAVIGILRCGEGPTAALRFDMDALPILESEDGAHLPAHEGFVSINGGSMHACGHDAHTTIGLYTAEQLMKARDALHGTVMLIFQPAEEGVRGARTIVEKGWLDHVDYLLGGHVEPSEDGSFYICPGMGGTFATTKLDAFFTGAPAHAGSAPEGGANCMPAIATAILNLQAISRHSGGASRINVGRVQAGTGRNVICASGWMQLEVRGETTAVNTYMEERARTVLKASAEMYGCSVEIKVEGSAPCIENSPALTEKLEGLLDENGFARKKPIIMVASEDFAVMAERVLKNGGQSCFTGYHTPMAAPAHTAEFDLDERIIPQTVCCNTMAVMKLLSKN